MITTTTAATVQTKSYITAVRDAWIDVVRPDGIVYTLHASQLEGVDFDGYVKTSAATASEYGLGVKAEPVAS